MTPAQALATLARAFPRYPVPAETATLYIQALADIPPAVLVHAVAGIINTRTSDRLPTVGMIREAAAEFTLALPTEAEALRQITARIDWARDRNGDPPKVHPTVDAALRQVGGYAAFRQADSGVVKGQFGRIYRDERAARIRDEQQRPVRAQVENFMPRAITGSEQPSN